MMLSSRWFRLFVVMLTCSTWALLEAQSPPDRKVPRFVADAAGGAPLEFVRSLAAAGVSLGAHVPAALAGPPWPHPKTAGSSDTTSLKAAVRRFAAVHPGWDVQYSEGVVSLRFRAIPPRRDVLPQVNILNQTVADALITLQRMIDPSIPPVAGIAGSMPSHPDAATSAQAPALVSVALQHVTLEQALNAIVAAAPGTAWMLVRNQDERGEPYDTLTTFFSDGTIRQDHWRLPLKSR